MAFAPIGQGFDQSTTARRAIGSRLKSGWISPVPVLTVACRCCRAPAARPASVPTACRARFGLPSGSPRRQVGGTGRGRHRVGVPAPFGPYRRRRGVPVPQGACARHPSVPGALPPPVRGTGWESRHHARGGPGTTPADPTASGANPGPSGPFVALGESPVGVRARPARHDFRGEPPTGADRTSAATPAPVRPWHPTGVRHRTQPPTSPAGRPTSPPATGAG